MKIGIDIGGTNTDAVLVDNKNNIVRAFKTLTTTDIVSGIKTALEQLNAWQINEKIAGVFIGTTHALNALLQGENLYKVGLLRIAGHKPDLLPPCLDFPEKIKKACMAGYGTINGGFEYDGRVISPLSKKEALEAAELLMRVGAEIIVVNSPFSPVYNSHELEVAEILKDKIPVVCSHNMGGLDFIERENTAILNAALRKVFAKGFSDIQKIIHELNIDAPIYFIKNNGTLMNLEDALKYPIQTIASGASNSFIGASKLAQCKNAIVMDIGGTSTDVGMIQDGFPRKTRRSYEIAGIKIHFDGPDVISFPLGGGSVVVNGQVDAKSVGKDLFTKAVSFGGDQITLTDAAISCDLMPFYGDHKSLLPDLGAKIIAKVRDKIVELYGEIDDKGGLFPMLLVGGGANLLGDKHVMAYGDVANAYGAALTEISHTIDRKIKLDADIEALKEEALEQAAHKGAENPKIIECTVLSYDLIPGNWGRVIVTAAGGFQG